MNRSAIWKIERREAVFSFAAEAWVLMMLTANSTGSGVASLRRRTQRRPGRTGISYKHTTPTDAKDKLQNKPKQNQNQTHRATTSCAVQQPRAVAPTTPSQLFRRSSL